MMMKRGWCGGGREWRGGDAHPVDLMESVHVELPHKARELTVMRGRISVSSFVRTWALRHSDRRERTYVVVFEVRAQNAPAELADVRDHKTRESARQKKGGKKKKRGT